MYSSLMCPILRYLVLPVHVERNHAVSPLLGELLLPLQSNFYLMYRQELNQLVSVSSLEREATCNSVVTIGPRTLKFAEHVHTSFYSKYARFEEFSLINFVSKLEGKVVICQ